MAGIGTMAGRFRVIDGGMTATESALALPVMVRAANAPAEARYADHVAAALRTEIVRETSGRTTARRAASERRQPIPAANLIEVGAA
ncbi:MAG: hypothetical protein COT28_15650 [Methylobacterium sp. CG08_land_8_20_14_0_20_71_15]|nr:MAG: hypothetical protein COT56_06450 [Methylobacterium sp. CG09_land_8_20_14_0_10_71_15]PIU12236.1 MAG: hypothetical protein COT28_15650 [Methylobacterium sp. CG08_land_8_20_14_0_20_71_15]